jgi:hypothetical protein
MCLTFKHIYYVQETNISLSYLFIQHANNVLLAKQHEGMIVYFGFPHHVVVKHYNALKECTASIFRVTEMIQTDAEVRSVTYIRWFENVWSVRAVEGGRAAWSVPSQWELRFPRNSQDDVTDTLKDQEPPPQSPSVTSSTTLL